MSRGKTLGALVTQLRSVLGHDRSPAAGGAFSDSLKEAIKSAQEELYDEYSWPFLYARRDKNLSAGSRYYDFPSDLPLENIAQVEALHNDIYHDIEYGITPEDYNFHNSDNDERADPVSKWMALNTGTPQFEVWPLPASTITGGIRFHGKKSLSTFVDSSDTADLDDRLICYRAAKILSVDEKRLVKFEKMERDRMHTLTGRLSAMAGSTPLKIGGDVRPQPWRGTTIRIAGA
jgi:hypothetical protein